MTPLSSIDRLVTASVVEELAGSPPQGSWESDWSALLHAMGQVWRDTPQATKDFLIADARRLLQQLGQDPRGAVGEIAQYAAFLVLGRGLPAALAVRTATKQMLGVSRGIGQAPPTRPKVARGQPLVRVRKATLPAGGSRRPPPPRPLSKTRWQRGRRARRFEARV